MNRTRTITINLLPSAFMVFVVLTILKLGEIGQFGEMSWWLVTMPLWLGVAILGAFILLGLTIALLVSIISFFGRR